MFLSVLLPREAVLNVLGSRYEASDSERVHYNADKVHAMENDIMTHWKMSC